MPSTFTSKALWKAVGYVLILHIVADIASHLLWQNIHFDLPDELRPNAQVDAPSNNRQFWLKRLPGTIIFTILITPLNYKWQCWLEWMFPGRRGSTRTTTPTQVPEKVDIDSDDEREERIMRKLIAKGKVQRSGLSWFNTFVKWILDITLANLFFICASAFIEDAIDRNPLSETWQTLKIAIIPMYALTIFSVSTLITLISFIAIPVQHRLPFEAAGGLAWNIFFGAFMNVFVPWLMGLQFTKDSIANITESIKASKNAPSKATTTIYFQNETWFVAGI